MRQNLVRGKVGIDFLDGFIHSAMNELLMSGGIDSSGLYRYYVDRIENRIGGILEYERDLADYVIKHCQGQRIVEVGTGLGELPIILALNGVTAAGVEKERRRQMAATHVRDRLLNCFSELDERYEFIAGEFPDALADSTWIGPGVTLLFTNVVGWDQNRAERINAFLPRVGEVILELRMFGILRDTEAERQDLFDCVAASAKSAERLPALSPGTYFARFTF
jgi:hypothetical protein